MRNTRWTVPFAVALVCALVVAMPVMAHAAKPGGGTTTFTVTGKVTSSATGLPIPGAAVVLSKYTSKTKQYVPQTTVYTNASGIYIYTGAPAPWKVTVTQAGYTSASAQKTVVAGETWTQDFSLVPTTATVAGVVRDSASQGLPGALVEVRLQSGDTWTLVATTTTDASGIYSYTGNPGTWQVKASNSGYITENAEKAVVAGEIWTRDFSLSPAPVSVTGTVRSSVAPFAPVAGGAVEFRMEVSPNTYSSVATVYTDVSGHYAYDAIPGNYEIVFSAAGYLPDTQYATVAVGLVHTRDAILDPAPATINGTVTNASTGAAIPDALVEFELYDSETGHYFPVASLSTDAGGFYSYSGVAGTYRITYSRNAGWPGGYVNRVFDQVASPGATYAIDTALTPIPATGVWGIVWKQFAADPGPISGATVEFRSQTGPAFPTTQNLYSVHFVDASTGWAVGYAGTILRTADGGATWTQQTSGTTNYLDSVYFANSSAGWAVGYSGTVRKTADGGATWTPQTSGTTRSLSSVHFVDASTGWVVGASGTVLKTTNGGATWMPQTSGTTYALESVSFVDASTGWAVGGYGTILKTTNGGATWTPQTSGTTQTLYSVSFADASTGWAVGDWATILKTTDGGTTWTPQASGATQALYSVHFTDASTGWIAGSPGTIFKTSDGGATWTPQACGTTSTLLSVHFIDSSTGWAVGPSGTIVMTTDGGNTWTTPGAYTTVATAYTGTDGFYAYDAPPGSYQLVFSKDGYLRDTQYVTVTTGSVYRCDAYLPGAP